MSRLSYTVESCAILRTSSHGVIRIDFIELVSIDLLKHCTDEQKPAKIIPQADIENSQSLEHADCMSQLGGLDSQPITQRDVNPPLGLTKQTAAVLASLSTCRAENTGDSVFRNFEKP